MWVNAFDFVDFIRDVTGGSDHDDAYWARPFLDLAAAVAYIRARAAHLQISGAAFEHWARKRARELQARPLVALAQPGGRVCGAHPHHPLLALHGQRLGVGGSGFPQPADPH